MEYPINTILLYHFVREDSPQFNYYYRILQNKCNPQLNDRYATFLVHSRQQNYAQTYIISWNSVQI